MAFGSSSLRIILANVLVPVAILIFATGFFPYKPFFPGLAQYDALEYGSVPAAPFDKVVFMVVDALRSDFVYLEGSGFNFTRSLIASGEAIPFTAHATSPTITMPRIKAITTGSIPSFLDVILNFAESDTTSTLAAQDTWLAQMKAKNMGKAIMYGDDTWLKLFPDTFDRAEGTTSFFVADFTEVDNNVTRHVPDELRRDDWNTMILHYLGLDHIGHKAGPKSPNMIPKQQEMDGIVQQIYTAMATEKYLRSTLFVLCGDHGMTDAGNHGGSAPGETSPALIFMSPKLKQISSAPNQRLEFREDFQYYSIVEQSDVVPTLAALLGFPVPKNNLGVIISEFLPFWPDKADQIRLAVRNAKQMVHIASATFTKAFGASYATSNDCTHVQGEDRWACEWQRLERQLDSPEAWNSDLLQDLLSLSQQFQNTMSSTASNYDIPKILSGLAIAIIATSIAFSTVSHLFAPLTHCTIVFAMITILYGVMMFASSYVEEEQNFWYWASSAWFAILTLKGTSIYFKTSDLYALGGLASLVCLRVARRWNQTGQKYAGEVDIVRGFLTLEPLYLWDFIGLTYLYNGQSLARRGLYRLPKTSRAIVSALLLVVAVTFKINFTNEDAPELIAGLAQTIVDTTVGVSLVMRAKAVFIAIALVTAYVLQFQIGASDPLSDKREQSMRALHDLTTLFLITQSRATNIPLFLFFELILQLLLSLPTPLTPAAVATTTLLLQHASFFALGNSNAISSIDLSSAYNGVSSYNVLAVGALTFVSNWAGPMFWASAANLLLLRAKRSARAAEGIGAGGGGGEKETKEDTRGRGGDVLGTYLGLLTLFTTATLASVMAACAMLRAHLFIWTVFSPKYLYAMAWGMGQHLLINVGLGSLLYFAGSL